ncbi:hypothetical protein [Niabella beijingensis]|uniref:hypothetical protein n=1 Tax=Niabella beijingensis TaxID=2872700 RepID=UPI001CBD2684|nr:hypothetical protein [Niabella beijingensis]MBZ4192089.1 hypothetical protein [Niabella beijingensis]
MKTNFFTIVFIALGGLFFTACNTGADVKSVDLDSLRADSVWKVRIADSINQARGMGDVPSGPDTGSAIDIETVTSGMKEGLNKVQEGLDKAKKLTDESSKNARELKEGIRKTSDAVHKTVDEARKTINGE